MEFRFPVEDGSELMHTERETSLHVDGQLIGKGTLYISHSSFRWESDPIEIKLLWPSIILHAVCRDSSVFPRDCLYLHTDADIPGISKARSEDSDDEYRDECPPVTELYFTPEDKESLQILYNAMATCQEKNPDPNDYSSSDDFYDEDEEIEVDQAHQQMEGMHISQNGTHEEEDMFEDADEEIEP